MIPKDNSMKIHNFYGDLLLYVRFLFEKFLGPETIKNYQFNIESIPFQVDYSKQPELPSAIVEFNGTEKITYPPAVIQGSTCTSNSAFPILYDENKDLALYLQEILHELRVTFTINLNSQLNALNIKHTLEKYLPPQKYIQYDSFISFYELDEALLHPILFDINKDKISNLFLRSNWLTDGVDYCYSVNHEPIAKLESCDVQLGDTSQRSFSCTGQIGFTMGVPMHTYIPEEYIPTIPTHLEEQQLQTNTVSSGGMALTLDIKEKEFDSTSLPFQDNIQEEKFILPFKRDDKGNLIETYNYHVIENETIILSDQITINGKIDKHTIFGAVNLNYRDNTYRNSCYFFYNFNDEISQLYLTSPLGPFRGEITDTNLFTKDTNLLDYTNKSFSGAFTGTFYGKQIETVLNCEFELERIEFDVSKLSYITNNHYTSNPNITYNKPVDVPYVNYKRCKVQCKGEKSKIKAIYFYFKSSNLIIKYRTDQLLDKYGSFVCDYEFSIGTDIRVKNSVIGKMDFDSLIVDHSFGGNTTDLKYEIYAFEIDYHFVLAPLPGLRTIQKISINIDPDFQPILTSNAQSYIEKLVMLRQKNKYSRILQLTKMRDEIEKNITFISDHKVQVRIVLDEEYNYDKDLKINNVKWAFVKNQETYTSNCSEIKLKERTNEDRPNVLKFIFNKSLYDHLFSQISFDNLLFFELYYEGG